jgi:hypothetical protein
MADTFAGFASLMSQAEKWADVTPTDGVPLASVPKALWVNVAGNLAIAGSDGVAVIFAVAAGLQPLRPTIVLATGTTATGIKALY